MGAGARAGRRASRAAASRPADGRTREAATSMYPCLFFFFFFFFFFFLIFFFFFFFFFAPAVGRLRRGRACKGALSKVKMERRATGCQARSGAGGGRAGILPYSGQPVLRLVGCCSCKERETFMTSVYPA